MDKFTIIDKDIQKKGGIIKSKMIIPNKTYQNRNESTKKAEKIDYEELRDFVIANRLTFIENRNKRHQINVLTPQGWRSGKIFSGYQMDFYDPSYWYNDDDQLDYVYGIQILEF